MSNKNIRLNALNGYKFEQKKLDKGLYVLKNVETCTSVAVRAS